VILNDLKERLARDPTSTALTTTITTTSNESFTRGEILKAWEIAISKLDEAGVESGDVIALVGDYRLATIGYLLALIERVAIVVPLSANSPSGWEQAASLVHSQFIINTTAEIEVSNASLEKMAHPRFEHAHYRELRRRRHAGLVLLSSGSTGHPKAVVHDFESFLSRFQHPPRPVRTLAFMQFDHVGGIYNLFSCLFNLSPLFFSTERSPDRVGELIEKNKIEFLPTSASFLNILLVSRPWHRYDFSSLKYVVYGTERVNPLVLERITKELPHVKFHQNYGLSEVGLLRSQSKASDSTLIKIDDDKAEVRIRNGILEIRSSLTMLGYLNAEHSTSDDGWYITGDLAEIENGWIRVIGRASDLIKVAGNAVHPSEIEDVIIKMPEVIDVVVGKESNLLIGEIITTTVQVEPGTDFAGARQKVREFCATHLERHKVPSKINITSDAVYGPRFKKKRSSSG
jgi:long-chain acyl-CoA synthetase